MPQKSIEINCDDLPVDCGCDGVLPIQVMAAKGPKGGKSGKDGDERVKAAVICLSDDNIVDVREAMKGRSNTVMTRVNDENLEVMDKLVDAGVFESRSECAAFFIQAGMEGSKSLLGKVDDTAKKIRDLKEKLKKEMSK
jgi:hypothetical protein